MESEAEAAGGVRGVVGNVGQFLPEHEQFLCTRSVLSGVANDRRIVMEVMTSLVAMLTLLILLAATSIRFGVDSREGYARQPDQIRER